MMLVGEGALRFAKDYGYQGRRSADRASRAWRGWCGSARCAISNGHTNWESGVERPPKPKKIARVEEDCFRRPTTN